MKKLYFLLCLPLLLAASCKKENPSPLDKLPPATMTGANTFGCLVNGKVWLPHTEAFWDPALDVTHTQWSTGGWQLKIGARKDNTSGKSPGILQSFSINVWYPIIGNNTITPINSIFIDFEDCGFYRIDTFSPHNMLITRLDVVDYIASGTFYFTAINEDCQDTIHVTEGRFDADSHL